MLERLLLTVGEGAEGDPGAAGGGSPQGNNGAAWYAAAETLKESDPEVWQSFEKGVQSGNHKDFPTLVKHVVGLEKRLGNALSLPGKDAKPEEVVAFKSKLYDAGVLARPPESPDKYELNLDAIPESMRADEFVKSVRQWAHAEGVSNEGLSKLVGLYGQMFDSTISPAMKEGVASAMKEVGEWAQKVGKSSTEVLAYAGAWLTKNLSAEQIAALEAIKIPGPDGKEWTAASHPALVQLVARAGMDTGEDISIVGEGEAERSPDALAAEKEANDIMRNKENPKYKLFWQDDPGTNEYVRSLMQKAHPGEIAQ